MFENIDRITANQWGDNEQNAKPTENQKLIAENSQKRIRRGGTL